MFVNLLLRKIHNSKLTDAHNLNPSYDRIYIAYIDHSSLHKYILILTRCLFDKSFSNGSCFMIVKMIEAIS